jgi:multiple sugar transport system permease protein
VSLASAAVRAGAPARASGRARAGSGSTPYLMLAPAVFLLALAWFVPIALVALMSFTRYKLGDTGLDFIGLANYARAFGDGRVIHAAGNNILYAAMVVPASVLAGLGFALLINGRKASRGLYEVLFFLPVTATLVPMSIVWMFLLHGRIGPINSVIAWLGFARIDFFTDPKVVLIALAVIEIWHLAAFATILYLAGLTTIPRVLYDAAAIDGERHPIGRFFLVTWPMLARTTVFVAVTTTVTALQVFDTVLVLTRGGPMGASDVMLNRIYIEGFRSLEMGYASALTMLFLAAVLVVSLVQTRSVERRVAGR